VHEAFATTTGAGGWDGGGAMAPQKFELVKIRAKSPKFGQNVTKCGKNMRKHP